MSTKISTYLQQHIHGEATAAPDIRRWFSTDASIFTQVPAIVVYPANEYDVRKTARFTWQLAERGQVLPITARGAGSDMSGAAIGRGIIVTFPAHMHRILALDSQKRTVTVDPGISFVTLEQTLHTHGLFMPTYPASYLYATIGGAVANNSSGEKSVKYGAMKQFVTGLHVVLANGEVIETKRLSKRELKKKMGLTTFEGEIYRQIDGLIKDNEQLIKNNAPKLARSVTGYDIGSVRDKKGTTDLTPLFIGSQGTLGIITEITLKVEPHNPIVATNLIMFDDLDKAFEVIPQILKLEPSAIELMDEHALNMIQIVNSKLLQEFITGPLPKAMILVEFDDQKVSTQKKKLRKLSKIARAYAVDGVAELNDVGRKEQMWKLRYLSSMSAWGQVGGKKPVPIIEDASVPVEELAGFVKDVRKVFAKYRLTPALWGSVGEGNVHFWPRLDLGQTGDRQVVFRLMDEYYGLVLAHRGVVSSAHNDGRIRGMYLPKFAGKDMYMLYKTIKKAFDPYGTLNPDVKIDVKPSEVKPLIRKEYTTSHLGQHIPHI